MLFTAFRCDCQTARTKKREKSFPNNVGSAAQILIGLSFEPDSQGLRKACCDFAMSF